LSDPRKLIEPNLPYNQNFEVIRHNIVLPKLGYIT